MANLATRVWRRLNAAQIALLSFALFILLGALILMLPVSTNGRALDLVDAFFTATSAVCVTGLIVVDTGSKFTGFGQAVILFLIQVGGFGVMTFGTFILFMVGRKASLQVNDAASGSFLKLRRYTLNEMLSRALIFTLAIEAGGAVLLFSRWINDFSFGRALWLSVFHSISAFCNAGFSLFPDSLMGYAGDRSINFTVMTLIVAGGLGFFVLIDLWDTLHRDPDPAKRRVSFHTKIVVFITVLLLAGGTAGIYLIERNHNLAGLSTGQALMRSLFQSVNSRTAGFNTLDIHHLANASLFLAIFLMFIGGAPGSMAGGVKVTTIGVILLVIISRFRRMGTPALFGRSVREEDLERAISLLLLSGALVGFTVLILLISELGGTSHVESRGLFMEILFECISAFGTVGLSTGVTPTLSPGGRIAITLLMFIGRLGPLTLVFALERRRQGIRYRFPEEQIMIG